MIPPDWFAPFDAALIGYRAAPATLASDILRRAPAATVDAVLEPLRTALAVTP